VKAEIELLGEVLPLKPWRLGLDRRHQGLLRRILETALFTMETRCSKLPRYMQGGVERRKGHRSWVRDTE
jgi:hypothetical protein